VKSFKHNPHPVDLSDFMYGRQVVMGGWDYEQEEKKQDEKSTQETILGGRVVRASVNKLRRSVSERLFSMELGKISF
jgi:hypothetical protein